MLQKRKQSHKQGLICVCKNFYTIILFPNKLSLLTSGKIKIFGRAVLYNIDGLTHSVEKKAMMIIQEKQSSSWILSRSYDISQEIRSRSQLVADNAGFIAFKAQVVVIFYTASVPF